jgi:hypothetical protein
MMLLSCATVCLNTVLERSKNVPEPSRPFDSVGFGDEKPTINNNSSQAQKPLCSKEVRFNLTRPAIFPEDRLSSRRP